MINDGDCGAIGGLKISKGNRSTRRKKNLTPAPFYPPQMPYEQTRARNQAAAVGSQGVAAWAMGRRLGFYICRLSQIFVDEVFSLTPEPQFGESEVRLPSDPQRFDLCSLGLTPPLAPRDQNTEISSPNQGSSPYGSRGKGFSSRYMWLVGWLESKTWCKQANGWQRLR
jgi:hypothetical protein